MYVWHDWNMIYMTHLCVTWLIFCRQPLCPWTPVTWLIHVCELTQLCVWNDSYICDMYVRHDSFTCVLHALVTYLIVLHDSCMCANFMYVKHESFTYMCTGSSSCLFFFKYMKECNESRYAPVNESCDTATSHEWVMSHKNESITWLIVLNQ